MAEFYEIHPENPQSRLIKLAFSKIDQGGIVAFPTDSGFSLGAKLGDKKAVNRISRIRELDKHHNFTLFCKDLSELSTYAKVNNSCFRLIKSHTPGPYTFIFNATSQVPNRLVHPKRKTIGIRVPDHAVTQALLEEAKEPLMGVTLDLPNVDVTHWNTDKIVEHLDKLVDVIIGSTAKSLEFTTVVDFTSGSGKVLRHGAGVVDWE